MQSKETFLKKEFLVLIKTIDRNRKPIFGKMNVHQMIEHMSHAFQIASGKLVFENKQRNELTAKMYQFMMSDKPFRDNTPNPNLADTPLPPRFMDVEDSLNDLKFEMDAFFIVYEQPELRVTNPFFGNLNKEEQVHLLHKHALHHLRQFGVLPE